MSENCKVCLLSFPEDTMHDIAGVKMCQRCYVKEQELQSKNNLPENAAARVEAVNAAFTEKASKREKFFVEEREAINSLQGSIAEQYKQVKARIEEWQEVLFESNVKREANYVKLQELARQLRADERTALGIKYAEYNPGELNLSNVKPVVKKERMSAEDKSILKMAEVLFGKKMSLGNMVQTVIAKEHPEYFVNGHVKDEFKTIVEKIHQDKGTMTEWMAIDAVKLSIRSAKAATISKIAQGELHIDGTERK